ITSWKMTEHMYFNINNPFPTMARGLFTEELEEGEEGSPAIREEDKGRERIVGRGYDKFFNIDEVPWTNWETMQDHTEGPYYITLKSNGCLILISAISPEYLLVASKHSLGTTVEQQTKVHAEEGRKWLRRTLQKSGKTEAELAARLWERNLTAVLELCDDSFEEHVIATPVHWTGLHLHGLNTNTATFSSLPPDQVAGMAQEFGFIPTKYIVLPNLSSVRVYTEQVSQSGSWEGEQIEGFVVRCTVKSSPKEEGQPPYSPGTPFFFKVKFEEPYKLYRTWREITRVMLPLLQLSKLSEDNRKQSEVDIWRKVGRKVSRGEEAVYADWVGDMMSDEPSLFDDYDRGVVRVREKFLAWTESEGKEKWELAKKGKYKLKGLRKDKQQAETRIKEGLKKKWIIVPVAVPGCGKTMVGVALKEMFGFTHTQSDDVRSNKTAPTFLKNIADLLKTHDVVYADRNNHIDKHYDELSNFTEKHKFLKSFDIHLIGILWDVTSQPYHRVLRTCSQRVIQRGDNHQTLRPDMTPSAEHEVVVGQFIRNFTLPPKDIFDLLITVPIDSSLEKTLSQIITDLRLPLNLAQPTEEDVKKAVQKAKEYRTTTPFHPPATKVGRPPRYYALAPEISVVNLMDQLFHFLQSEQSDVLVLAREMYQGLKDERALTVNPHITLVHEKTVADETERLGNEIGPHGRLWEVCKIIQGEMRMFKFRFTHLVWNDRVMALAVDSLETEPNIKQEHGRGGEGTKEELDLPDDVRQVLHVTVGVKEGASAFESRALVRKLRETGGSLRKGEVLEEG
ncbi:hypothetical protein TREMEDRAFT_20952, partial [Tremella mesenterica DSM 1558]|uniref:uncharacterized protein n=1 Tax=Tremella mesenterica (strain ATCC 24925 / CBS 8224 / DSM 1558 / NBRC 9311 / NRRL Y-6157 / RJB 2259-6 / UBC 559-6) TaxID=578456 RepID=UPI0003F4937D